MEGESEIITNNQDAITKKPTDQNSNEQKGNEQNNSPESSAGRQESSEREAELEGMLAAKNEELARSSSRLVELELSFKESGGRLEEVSGRLKKTVAGYKTLLATANPDVLPELLSGESLEELDMSLARARELTGRIKANLEEQARKGRVPAGAPARGPLDDSRLSSREKIVRGLENRR